MQAKEVKIVKELTEMSTENCKYYKLSNGNTRVVQSISQLTKETIPLGPVISLGMYQANSDNIFTQAGTCHTIENLPLLKQRGVFLKLTPRGFNTNSTITKVEISFTEMGNCPEVFQVCPAFGLEWIIPIMANPTDFIDIRGTGTARRRVIDVTDTIMSDTNKTHYVAIIPTMDNSSTLSLYTPNSTQGPSVIFEYMSTEDSCEQQSYIEGGASFGDYKINTRTGKLNLTKQLMSLGGNKMPLNLSVSYSIERAGSSTINDSIPTHLPKGWKFNYQQFVYQNVDKYIYVDEAYNAYGFVLAENCSNIYFEQSGSGLVLTVNSGSATERYKIEDDTGMVLTFDSGGLLKTIKKNGFNFQTTIAHDANGKLTSVIDGQGRQATVTYGSSGISISCTGNSAITMSFNSDSLLTGITDADAVTNAYTYSSNRLVAAKSSSGEKNISHVQQQ